MEAQVEVLIALLLTKLHRLPESQRILVAISGRPGGGKSSLTAILLKRLNEAVPSSTGFLPQDGFHLTKAQLDQFPDPASAHYRRGAPDTFDAEGWVSTIRRIKVQQPNDPSIWCPDFHHELKDPSPNGIEIKGSYRLVLLEGSFILLDKEPWRQAGALYDERVMVEAARELCTERVARRNFAAGIFPTYDATLARVMEIDAANGDYTMANSLPPTFTVKSVEDRSYVKEAEAQMH